MFEIGINVSEDVRSLGKRFLTIDWLKKAATAPFFCSKLATNFLWQQRTFSRTVALGVRVRGLTLERVFRAQKRHRLGVKSSWAAPHQVASHFGGNGGGEPPPSPCVCLQPKFSPLDKHPTIVLSLI